MELIKSNRGKDKICLNGYMYVMNVQCKNFIRWKCAKASSLKCGAILKTTLNKTDPNLANPHNHAADAEGTKVVQCVQTMKEKAKDNGVKPVQIFAEGVSKLESSTKARMPSEEVVKRTLRNQRSKNNPKEPYSLRELIIEGNFVFFL